MQRITHEIESAEDHLALDEALLLAAEDGCCGESLRVWQFPQPIVVVGRSSRVDQEVDRQFCDSQGIGIRRRCSGGAAVVGGPGCLMYSVVMALARAPGLQKIDVAHRYVMQRVRAAVRQQVPEVEHQGTCDLTWQNRKFSGNSLRISRAHLLYHGTVLYDADLELIGHCLLEAPRQPEYRDSRDHRSFVTNIPIDPKRLTVDVAEQFNARDDQMITLPIDRMRRLRQERYDLAAWHFRH